MKNFNKYSNKIIYYLTTLLLVSGMHTISIANSINKDEIVLIFKKIPKISNSIPFSKTGNLTTTTSPVILFDEFDTKELVVNYKSIVDTIIIRTNSKTYILRHRYDALNYIEFIINKGDSVLFKYENGKPIVKVLNRKTLKFDFSYDILLSQILLKEKIKLFDIYLRPYLSIPFLQKDRNSKVEKLKNELYAKIIMQFENEEKLLDSLKQNNLLSESNYLFYKDRIIFNRLRLRVLQNKISMEEIKQISINSVKIKHDFPNKSYDEFLKTVGDEFFVEKSKLINFSNGASRDYRESYELIRNDHTLSQKDREFLLSYVLNFIQEYFSRAEFKKYFKMFEQDAKDIVTLNRIRERFLVQFDENSSENISLVLMNNEKKKISFEEIKTENRGKVMYIDFWASWCAPCRKALPHSRKLREELKDRNIVFIYLSTDTLFESWFKASDKETLNTYSYLIINTSSSEFMKKQKINAIPRYMIFDKLGKLVYANAPNVESKDLVSLLTNLANQ